MAGGASHSVCRTLVKKTLDLLQVALPQHVIALRFIATRVVVSVMFDTNDVPVCYGVYIPRV